MLYEARIAFLLYRQNTKKVEYLTDSEMCENDWYQYRALLVQIYSLLKSTVQILRDQLTYAQLFFKERFSPLFMQFYKKIM